MALLKTIELPNGLSVTNAYIRVRDARVWRASDGQGYVMVSIEVYKDADAKEAKKSPISCPGYDMFKFAVDVTATVGTISMYGLAYSMLKAHPAFEGAQDV